MSPEGNLAVVGIQGDGTANGVETIMLLRADGAVFKQRIPFSSHSLDLSEDHVIVMGTSPEGTPQRNRIFVMDADGGGGEVALPQDYDAAFVPMRYSTVNYMGDGVFEILQTDRVDNGEEGERTEVTAFEVRVTDSRAQELETQQVRHRVMTRYEDAAVSDNLPYGESGFIDADGKVFISRRDSEKPEYMGTVADFAEEGFLRVRSKAADPKFALKREGYVEIRSWNNPERVVATLNTERFACRIEQCGIAAVTEIS
ncbi:hypothetical protein G7Y31_00885 [Corynebacterium lizhenjunii]|uniref:Phytase-like domain-containing protein n=1 Tax=Corynebacterium lizhenjunii TaxID=2709394 RepID=A0A7T0KFC8_9CORY|nr:hypothetical protein [Corynebacterium lizhenjunii]QPK79316.1 hypothetical protein G7Y31_00885 [Corynebacterium lizhenjunii]